MRGRAVVPLAVNALLIDLLLPMWGARGGDIRGEHGAARLIRVARSRSVGQYLRDVGVKDTGSDSSPLMKLDGRWRNGPSLASRRSGSRTNSCSNITRSSMRASWLPRQKCDPKPNARCGFG